MTDQENREKEERRSSRRIPTEMWVEESTERELYFQQGANISMGGLFLERTIPHPRGTAVSLRFTLPNDADPIEVKGTIVNIGPVADELGMGVKFTNLNDKDKKRIEKFIDSVAETNE